MHQYLRKTIRFHCSSIYGNNGCGVSRLEIENSTAFSLKVFQRILGCVLKWNDGKATKFGPSLQNKLSSNITGSLFVTFQIPRVTKILNSGSNNSACCGPKYLV